MGSRITPVAWSVVVLVTLLPLLAAAQTTSNQPASQDPQTPLPSTTFTVTVVGATPLAGIELPIEQVPAPVQTLTGRNIETSGALDLSDFLDRRLNGVHVNEMQGNPFQPDVNYRGYTASPLLGTPQGLSVYMDGVRLNQPFGDVVSWDLIPQLAIFVDDADAGIESAVRPQHARRRAVDSDQGRPQQSAARLCRRSTAATSRRALEFEHGGSRAASGFNWYRRRQSLRRRRLARRLALRRAAAVRQARLAAAAATCPLSARLRRQLAQRQRSAGAAAFSSATTPASTRSPTTPTTARRSSTSRRATRV